MMQHTIQQQFDIARADLGMPTLGRAITATLYVSPAGNGTTGSNWNTAYTTIQDALDAASTDANDCTLILIAPHATYYDINTTGDPTWTGNYILKGTHRRWASIRNEHASATSVFKFTGKAALNDLAISTADAVNGVIFTNDGCRVRRCGFNSSGTSGANTSIHIDGSAGLTMGGIIEDVQFIGNVLYTTPIYINHSTFNEFHNINIHFALVGVQIVGTDSDNNFFYNIDVGGSTIGFDIDEGNSQHFTDIRFHENTTNIDDEVGDHHYESIIGEFLQISEPDNFTGVAVDTGDGANTWTAANVEVRAAATGTKPFRITRISTEAGTGEKYRIRLSADGGATYFIDFQFEGVALGSQSQALNFPTGTDFVFNAWTAITASSKSEGAGVDELDIWLHIQEI